MSNTIKFKKGDEVKFFEHGSLIPVYGKILSVGKVNCKIISSDGLIYFIPPRLLNFD